MPQAQGSGTANALIFWIYIPRTHCLRRQSWIIYPFPPLPLLFEVSCRTGVLCGVSITAAQRSGSGETDLMPELYISERQSSLTGHMIFPVFCTEQQLCFQNQKDWFVSSKVIHQPVNHQ